MEIVRRFTIFLLAVFSCASYSFAAPNITDTSGTLSYGSTITANGSGFGPDGRTQVITDNFEGGGFNPSWTDTGNLKVTNAVTQRSAYSTYCATHNFVSGADKGYVTGGTDSRKWFVQYWALIAANFDWGTTIYSGNDKYLANVKFARWWSQGSSSGNVYGQFGYPDLSLRARSYFTDESLHENNAIFPLTMSSITVDVWHCYQFEFNDSSIGGAYDASLKFWFDGALVYSSSSFMGKNPGVDADKRPLIVGFYNAWSPLGDGSNPDPQGDQAPNTFYEDDVVIQNSFERVELSSSPIYNNPNTSVKREYQQITSWADGQIKFVFNQGQLASSPIYAYVTDGSGVTSPAFQINSSGGSAGVNAIKFLPAH